MMMNLIEHVVSKTLLLLLTFSSIAVASVGEFEALLDVESTTEVYNLNFAKVNDAYADSAMKVYILKCSDSLEGSECVEAVESAATAAWSGSTTVVTASGTTLAASVLYSLTFNDDHWMSVFPMQFSTTGHYAFFLEHDPDEFHFEGMDSYLTDEHGDTVSWEWSSSDTTTTTSSSSVDWGAAFGACFVVWAATFGMIVLYHLLIGASSTFSVSLFNLGKLQMFAAGTLLATAFGLIMFESARTLTEDTGVASLWTFCVLFGFICPTIVDQLMTMASDAGTTATPIDSKEGEGYAVTATTDSKTVEMVETGTAVQDGVSSTEAEDAKVDASAARETVHWFKVLCGEYTRKVAATILIGDFLHNFADGIFIASAFNTCTSALGWTIAAATVLHELPQELSDAAVLVEQLHMGAVPAALTNLFTGFSVVVGALFVYAMDVSDATLSYFLAFGAGNFIYLGGTEFFAKVMNAEDGAGTHAAGRDKAILIGLFALGALIILVVLLDHTHCEATEDNSTTTDAHNH